MIARVAVVALVSALGAGGLAGQTVPGVTFTMRMTTNPSAGGQGAADMPVRSSFWRSVITSASGRTRMETDSVRGDTPFRKGEYRLSDAMGSVMVNPVAKTFSVEADFSDLDVDSLLSSSGAQMSLKVLKSSVDSLGPGERVDGLPTMRYRINMTQAFSIGLPDAPPGVDMPSSINNEMSMTIEYWFVNAPTLMDTAGVGAMLERGPKRLAQRTARVGDMAAAMDSLMKKLPKGRYAAKTVTTVVTGMAGMLFALETTNEVSPQRSTRVDLRSLTVPDDYRLVEAETPTFGLRGKPAKNPERWKGMAWTSAPKPAAKP